MSKPKISVLLITYKRTEIALKTIRALKEHLIYPRELIHWHIADDGSSKEHIQSLVNEIEDYCSFSDAKRKGVGHSMNLGMAACLEYSNYILWLEDDWQLTKPYNIDLHIKMLQEWPTVGMIRLGYISPGIKGELISAANQLWWLLDKGPQYTFTGHAALRTREFCNAYGQYPTDRTPGQTELYMCGTFNGKKGPAIVVPADMGTYGLFGHIGNESYKDVAPGKE